MRMPIGKYKGKNVKDVPAGYLIYMLDKGYLKGQIRDHVIENLAYYKEKQWDGKSLSDQDIMPFGKYKGEKMEDVPAGYLLHIYKKLQPGLIKNYIRKNIDVLNKQYNENE